MKYRKYYKVKRDHMGRVVKRSFRNPVHNAWLNLRYWINPNDKPTRERFK